MEVFVVSNQLIDGAIESGKFGAALPDLAVFSACCWYHSIAGDRPFCSPPGSAFLASSSPATQFGIAPVVECTDPVLEIDVFQGSEAGFELRVPIGQPIQEIGKTLLGALTRRELFVHVVPDSDSLRSYVWTFT